MTSTCSTVVSVFFPAMRLKKKLSLGSRTCNQGGEDRTDALIKPSFTPLFHPHPPPPPHLCAEALQNHHHPSSSSSQHEVFMGRKECGRKEMCKKKIPTLLCIFRSTQVRKKWGGREKDIRLELIYGNSPGAPDAHSQQS